MKSLAVLIFPGFQTLDLFGPLEMLGSMRNDIEITIVAETLDAVPSVHGQRLCVDKTLNDGTDYDLLFIPGGDSALDAAKKSNIAQWIVQTTDRAELVMTVCTGSILLATTGVLDGHRATTNKIDFSDTIHLGPKVDWVKKARWVEDGKFFTSSGVSAGIDMALAVLAHLFGPEVAVDMAEGSEYEWHDDPDWDPFAARAGLVTD
ncbi:MAG: DJ-1/PfpI family protein [Pseudomonadota bacterium]